MAKRLGMSTATFSKYRRTIKLPKYQLDEISRFLDSRIISLDSAYLISDLPESEVQIFIDVINEHPQNINNFKIRYIINKIKKNREVLTKSSLDCDLCGFLDVIIKTDGSEKRTDEKSERIRSLSEESEIKGKAEAIKSLMDNNMSFDDAVKLAGVTKKEIENIRDYLKRHDS